MLVAAFDVFSSRRRMGENNFQARIGNAFGE
jgi:hypothetical protein